MSKENVPTFKENVLSTVLKALSYIRFRITKKKKKRKYIKIKKIFLINLEAKAKALSCKANCFTINLSSKEAKIMGTTMVNFRTEEALKKTAYNVLKQKGVTPSDFYNIILQYVATTGKLPVQQVLLSNEEDAALLALVQKRIAEPEKFEEVTLDEL